ncbi:MAG: hypothetical protein K9M81_06305, partial [Chthoniobacterales bacterium]|nr:hypothetical protein [Chthoniobacterales bacterium]
MTVNNQLKIIPDEELKTVCSPLRIAIHLLIMLLFMIQARVSFAAPQGPSKPENQPAPLAPWMRPRELSNFQSLLLHSPFSLATAEESSPLSERYAITGIVTIDGDEEIFVLDKNDQNRELLTKKPNKKMMSLVNIVKDSDPNKLKATITVNGETGVITSPEPSNNNPMLGPKRFSGPNTPNGSNQQKNTIRPRNTPFYRGQTPLNGFHSQGTASNNNNRNTHRVINRPPI